MATERPLRGALTLKDLRDMVDTLISLGCVPGTEVLITADPEGNNLVSLESFACLAQVENDGNFVQAIPQNPSSETEWTEEDFSNPNNHVVFQSLHEVYWKE